MSKLNFIPYYITNDHSSISIKSITSVTLPSDDPEAICEQKRWSAEVVRYEQDEKTGNTVEYHSHRDIHPPVLCEDQDGEPYLEITFVYGDLDYYTSKKRQKLAKIYE